MGRAQDIANKLLDGMERDFIRQNPIPYRLEPVGDSSSIWTIFAVREGTEMEVGTLYYDEEIPENAHQYWRDHPWGVVPTRFSVEPTFFPTQQQAIDWAIRQ